MQVQIQSFKNISCKVFFFLFMMTHTSGKQETRVQSQALILFSFSQSTLLCLFVTVCCLFIGLFVCLFLPVYRVYLEPGLRHERLLSTPKKCFVFCFVVLFCFVFLDKVVYTLVIFRKLPFCHKIAFVFGCL